MRELALAVTTLVSTPAFAAGVEVLNRRLEPGQNILGALQSVNIDASQAMRLIDALDDVFDVRQARAGNQLRLVRVDGFVENLDFRVGPLDEYLVRRDRWRYVAEKRAVTFETKVVKFEFDVETSLYEAAMSTGRDPVIAMALADAFGWEMDLMRNAKLGDRAKVLVETLVHRGRVVRYGDVLAASYSPVRGREMEIFRYQLPSGERAYFFADGTSAQRTFLKSPVGYAPISSMFGYRVHPITGDVRFHDGVDYGMPTGTPVHVVSSGLVTFAGWTASGGIMVCVQHEGEYESCYLHLSKLAQGVQADAVVYRKQVIAWSGNTGATTRPHLHFNLKHNGWYVDPLRQRFPRTDALPDDLQASFSRDVASYLEQLRDESVPVLPSR